MAKKSVIGTCCICGDVGPLSFEHVPPSAAFNDRAVLRYTFEKVMELGPDDDPTGGKILQRGAGAHTLCARCNNNTGAWYGNQFVDWCHQGMLILQRSGGRPTLIYMNYVYPLATLKQIVTMFFSVQGPQFRLKNEELVRFVLNKDSRFLPRKLRFFVYFNIEGRTRYSATVGLMDLRSASTKLFAELTYPPYGYVMTFGDDAPHESMVEITHFSRYEYWDVRTMNLKLPVLPTFTAFPGDYRTREQIYAEAGMQPPVRGDV